METSTKKDLQTLDKYACIGFDMDHCLIRYKIKELFPIIYGAMATTLVNEKNYPKEMLEFGKRERCFIMNGLLIDFKTGYIIKLGLKKRILRAYYGYDRVSDAELEKRFGSPPTYEFDPYKLRAKEYYCAVTYFDCCLVAILAHMIQHKKTLHQENEINLPEIFKDLVHAEESNYLNWSPTKYNPIATYGNYYPTILENPEKYLYKQEKVKKMLKHLREKGKVLFIASNSHYEYLSEMMKNGFGEDWASLFDFVIPNSGKPVFFTDFDRPFYEVDESSVTRMGKEITELQRHGVYCKGNAKLLEENALRLNGNQNGRVLFFGDNYSTDALAAELIEHWDAVCIMEELGDVDFGEGYDGSYWGHWEYEETPEGRIPTFWGDYMNKNVAVCTHLVDSEEMIKFFEIPPESL